jgi:hypothetical protein
MAERSISNAFRRTGWLHTTPDRPDSEEEQRVELREHRLMIAAAVAIGVLNILIVAAAVWHPASTFELTPLLPK